jgi:hypothetical protein
MLRSIPGKALARHGDIVLGTHRRDSGLDLAASACLVVDLSAVVVGTGLAHHMA